MKRGIFEHTHTPWTLNTFNVFYHYITLTLVVHCCYCKRYH